MLSIGTNKKPTKLLNLVGFRAFCFSASGERGTASIQTVKNIKSICLYKNTIKSILYEVPVKICHLMSLDKIEYF